jgi:hypothetical protein
MKKLLALLIRLIQADRTKKDSADDFIFEHLDGAEFYVVLPPAKPQPTAD